MQTWIALLRGVNVGTAKRVPMAEFKALLEGQGLRDVATLLNSGSAVFNADLASPTALSQAISAALAAHFKFEVPVVIQSLPVLEQIIADNSLAASAPDFSSLLCVFTQDSNHLALVAGLEKWVESPEQLHIGQYAAYLYCAHGIRDSKAAKALTGKPALHVTTRNWATVLKLHALAREVQEKGCLS